MSRKKTIGLSSRNRNLLVVLTATLLLWVSSGPAVQVISSPPSSAAATVAVSTGASSDQENGEDASKVSAVYEAVIPIYKFQISFCCYFIRTFSYVEKVVTNHDFAFPLPQSYSFQRLLRRSISPNAP